MKRYGIKFAALLMVVALMGCKSMGGSNVIHYDSNNKETVEEFEPNEDGDMVMVRRTISEQSELVDGQTNAGLGRGIEGAATGLVEYNGETGTYKIDLGEQAAIEGIDTGGIFKAGFQAGRDIGIAQTEAPQSEAEAIVRVMTENEALRAENERLKAEAETSDEE